MSIVTIELQPRVKTVTFIDDQLSIEIADGRTVLTPLTWYPRLQYATKAEREDWSVFEDSEGRDLIFWERLDELIPVIALLAGVRSRESKRSVEKWLATRKVTA